MAGQRKTPVPVRAAVAVAQQALLEMRLEELDSCALELQTARNGLGSLSREEALSLARDIRRVMALARGAEDWIVAELALAADPPGPGYGLPESTGPSAGILVRG